MADSIRRRALAAFFAALDGIAGYTALRNPLRDPGYAQMPALVQDDGGEPEPQLVTGAEQFETGVTATWFVTGADEAALDAALDAAYRAVLAAIGADRTLGGLVVDVRRGALDAPTFARDEGAKPFAAQGCEFFIDYWTAEGDATALAPGAP